MINIQNKQDCCGCHACASICAKHCVTMLSDEEGFLYPVVDKDACIDCGLCERVCPVINQSEPRKPLKVYAAKNKNEEIRRQSSSGGIFTLLAAKVIAEDGIVFGARFDEEWNVIHSCTDTVEGIAAFRGSKYVQSTIGDTYREAKDFLKQGRKVLFSGTPCQIAGLKKYLRKDYANLLTVDVVCHGVPSPLVWNDYISSIAPISDISNVNLKDKRTGWKGYSVTIEYGNNVFTEVAKTNKYMLSFIRNYTLRPSCFNCPAKEGKSGSDITLADYWGVQHLIPSMDDNKGTSFVCYNTEKGMEAVTGIDMDAIQASYEDSIRYNSCIYLSTKEPEDRGTFWREYKTMGISALNSIRPQQENVIKKLIKKILQR